MRAFLILFVFAFFFESEAQIVKPADEILFEEFSDYAYNFDFKTAEKIADDLLSEFPHSPLGFHAYSMLQTWYYLGTRDEGILRTFFLFSDSVLARFDKLDDYDENPYYLFRAGEEYAFRALMYAFDLEKLDAFFAVRKSVSFFDDALEVNPEFYDAYSGPALFSYFLSFAPSFLKTGMYLFGINADALESLRSFQLTYEKGDFAKTEAAFQLSKIYSDYFFDIDSSDIFLMPIVEKFPGNMFFKYQFAINKIREKNFIKAKEILSDLISAKEKNFVQIIAFSYFLLGEINFYENDFRRSIENYEKYFENTRSINFMGYANYRCGLAYLMLGEKSKAREHFLLASYGNEDNYKDEFARKRSVKILESDFSFPDKNLIYAENFLQSGDYAKALSACSKIKEKNSARTLATCAEAALMNGNFKKAKKTLNLLKSRMSENKMTKIKFYYLSALYETEIGNIEKARFILSELFAEDNLNNELFAKARFLAREIGADFE